METDKVYCEECEDLSCSITSAPTLKGLQETVHKLRYAASEHETWQQTVSRTANAIAVAEATPELRNQYAGMYERVMLPMDFVPGGRILRNAGKVKGNLLNCFVLGVEDNIESIANDLYAKALIVSKYGGGIGFNASSLRPGGEELKSQGANSMASGTISFIDGLNHILNLIKGGGDRRAAGKADLFVWHPEIYNFINAKREDGKLSNFNLSVGVTNSFVKAVKSDKEWELIFGNKVYQTVRARDLWDCIVSHTWEVSEPGIMNYDNMQCYNNLWYCDTIASTNPCGELPLPVNSACCLGSINLNHMYDAKKNEVNWRKLRETIIVAVRFLDSVLDVTYYPITEIGLNVQGARRIGLGTMGLHHLMLKLGIKEYGSDEALDFIDDFYRRFRDIAYLASTTLSQEKGPFDKFVADKFLQGMFVSTLPRRIKKNIKEMGIRNGTVISIAPTGTIGLLAGTSQGVEPIFAPIYNRKYFDGGDIKEVTEWDSLFREFVKQGRDVSHFIGSTEVSPEQHLEVQSTVQQYVDNSISKTINIECDYSKQQLGSLLLDHINDIKGTTVYRRGSRQNEILTPCEYKMPVEQLAKMITK